MFQRVFVFVSLWFRSHFFKALEPPLICASYYNSYLSDIRGGLFISTRDHWCETELPLNLGVISYEVKVCAHFLKVTSYTSLVLNKAF
jgi:hypothetical protein